MSFSVTNDVFPLKELTAEKKIIPLGLQLMLKLPLKHLGCFMIKQHEVNKLEMLRFEQKMRHRRKHNAGAVRHRKTAYTGAKRGKRD